MNDGKTNMMYVLGTILVMLSFSMILNGSLSTEHVGSGMQSVSTALTNIVMPGEHVYGTLYDTYCYVHNAYFGLRF